MLEKIIKSLKGDPSYKLQSQYSFLQWVFIICYRSFQTLRGFVLKVKFHSAKGLLFCGRHVTVEHAYMVNAGKSLILEDNVILNALSINGITLGNNVNAGKYQDTGHGFFNPESVEANKNGYHGSNNRLDVIIHA